MLRRKENSNIISRGKDRNLEYLDQLETEKEIWVNRGSFTQYLKKKYGLTPQQYFNKVVYKDINFIPKCPICNKETKFYKLSRGYSSFCKSFSCAVKYMRQHPELFPNAQRQFEEFSKKGIALGTVQCNTTEVNIQKAYSQFIRKGDKDDICYLYLAWTKNNLKFGVTSSIENRVNLQKRINSNSYLSIHTIYKSDRISIAEIERKIKLKFEGREYLKKEELHELIQIIKSVLGQYR